MRAKGGAGATSANPVTLKHKSYTHRAARQSSNDAQFSQSDGKRRRTAVPNQLGAFSFLKKDRFALFRLRSRYVIFPGLPDERFFFKCCLRNKTWPRSLTLLTTRSARTGGRTSTEGNCPAMRASQEVLGPRHRHPRNHPNPTPPAASP